MITARAGRPPLRHRHLPLHRRRGLDAGCCTSWAPRATRRRSPSIAASCARRSHAHGGVEVDTQGDAFFVAFPTAPGALAAAVGALDGPRGGTDPGAHGHPHGHAARDRGGLRRSGRAPGGPDRRLRPRRAGARLGLHRLRSSARMELRDLGEHRLKDLSAPERIYQLGEGDFPPLKSLYRTNLPVPATAVPRPRARAGRGASALLARRTCACSR